MECTEGGVAIPYEVRVNVRNEEDREVETLTVMWDETSSHGLELAPGEAAEKVISIGPREEASLKWHIVPILVDERWWYAGNLPYAVRAIVEGERVGSDYGLVDVMPRQQSKVESTSR